MSQSFSHWFLIMSFKLNQDFIAKNICENRFRPKLKCAGNCVLMKKLKQKEQEEQNRPMTEKIDFSPVVISSRSFFANIELSSVVVLRSFPPLLNTGKPVDRTLTFFHPPAV